MFTRLVVGIDGFEGGEDALVLARMIARTRGGGELILVHAYASELLPSRAAERDYEAAVRAEAEAMLARMTPRELPCTTLITGDSYPGRALHRAAVEHHAELIVIGSCRRGVLGRVLLGDVSRSTLHGAPCPVAVAPRGYARHAQRPRLIGVGFTDTPEGQSALATAAGLVRGIRAALRVVTAAHTPVPFVPGYASGFDHPDVGERDRLAAEQALEAAVTGIDVPASAEMIDASPAAALTELSRHVDLLVAGSRGWGAARRIVLGSTTDHLVHHAACPVLVVPRPDPHHDATPDRGGGRRASRLSVAEHRPRSAP